MSEPKEIAASTWLRDMFEFENCCECGGDEKDHSAILLLGNWFALCL